MPKITLKSLQHKKGLIIYHYLKFIFISFIRLKQQYFIYLVYTITLYKIIYNFKTKNKSLIFIRIFQNY